MGKICSLSPGDTSYTDKLSKAYRVLLERIGSFFNISGASTMHCIYKYLLCVRRCAKCYGAEMNAFTPLLNVY